MVAVRKSATDERPTSLPARHVEMILDFRSSEYSTSRRNKALNLNRTLKKRIASTNEFHENSLHLKLEKSAPCFCDCPRYPQVKVKLLETFNPEAQLRKMQISTDWG